MTTLLEGQLDRYLLPDPVHRVGGEALIYRALAASDGAEVAVRVALDDAACGDALRCQAAWLREALARSSCARVVAPWDEGRWDGRPFLVLPWLPIDLEQHAAAGRPLGPVLAELCDAVEALHRSGLAHGDLKPGNVLISEPDVDPRPLIADPAPGGGITTGFASPERLEGTAPTPAADRWAMGLLVGSLLDAPGAADLDRPRVQRVIRRLAHPDPRRRPSLDALALALRAPARPSRSENTLGALALGGSALGASLAAMAVLVPRAELACPPDLAERDGLCVAPDGLELARVPAGRFRMGRPDDVPLRSMPDARPHTVRLDQPFLLATTEATQALWRSIAGDDPVRSRRQELDGGVDAPCDTWKGHPLADDGLPVVCVAWDDVVRWLNARSERDGLKPAYRIVGPDVSWDPDADGWRLPTEAEWERAARWDPPGSDPCARANTRDLGAPELWGGEAQCVDGDPVLAPSGRRPPNRLGLRDLEGNALEWVWDRYGPWDGGHATDPHGAPFGSARVLKGGSWNHVARGPAARYASNPSGWSYTTGFRIARTITGARPPAPR